MPGDLRGFSSRSRILPKCHRDLNSGLQGLNSVPNYRKKTFLPSFYPDKFYIVERGDTPSHIMQIQLYVLQAQRFSFRNKAFIFAGRVRRTISIPYRNDAIQSLITGFRRYDEWFLEKTLRLASKSQTVPVELFTGEQPK
jgi:hypothetical protein